MTLLIKAMTIIASIMVATAINVQAASAAFSDIDQSTQLLENTFNKYGLSLLSQKAQSNFAPENYITVSQAITLASRANALCFDREIQATSQNTGLWHSPYFEYAKEYGIILENEFPTPDAPAQRGDVALIFSRCLPDEYFSKINDIHNIPDVDENSLWNDALLKLYNAGILTGSDEYGFFRPKDSITHDEMMAMLNRILFPKSRISFEIEKYTNDQAYILCFQKPSFAMNNEASGISSGWQYDHRGSLPEITYDIDYNTITDISKTLPVSMIREFNNTNTGILQLETEINLLPHAFNGFELMYQNKNGQTVYRLFTLNDRFYVDTPMGQVAITDRIQEPGIFYLNIDVDLDNLFSTTAINKAKSEKLALCTDKTNTDVQRLVVGTTEEATSILNLGAVNITANYGFYDLFDTCQDGEIPYGWQGEGATNSTGTLDIAPAGYAQRKFKPVSRVVTADTQFILTQGQEIEFILLSGGKRVAVFSTDSSDFMFSGKTVYENYVENMWYRLRIEADTQNNQAKIWVNGRTVATVALEKSVSYIDSILIKNNSSACVSFDNINVFEKKEHADYVPEPVKPFGEEEYLVGIISCSLWKNGVHYGWSFISPFEDREPVLGYYDEGNPETADWEIKYMAEHGIDFQAFCWYADKSDEPLKNMPLSSHLYDGYMYAKYSDKMKYCLIWETATALVPKDMNAWEEYYIPYFIENFFKDDRYLVIDNKPVLSVFGYSEIPKKMNADTTIVKELFDALEQAVIEQLGFDGMIFLGCGKASETAESMGFDGVHAYHWGSSGYLASVNKNNILDSASYKGIHTVPTISVGFNSIPWHGTRYPLMSAENYKTIHKWVRDEYLTNYAKKGTWQENLVMLSTWNEYGEGTYIMPSEGNCGFEYLDAICEVYTSDKADSSLNILPNETQKRRINRLYPQHLRKLTKYGYYTELDDLQSTFTIDYSERALLEAYEIKNIYYTSSGFHGVTNGDGRIYRRNLAVDAERCQYIAVTVDGKVDTVVEVFFITSLDDQWTQDKSISFCIQDDGMQTYYLDMSTNSGWQGKITALRIDVGHVQSGTGTYAKNAFTLSKADFMYKEALSRYMQVNDFRFEMQLPYRLSESGDVYFAFDPKVSMDYRFGTFMTWDYFTKTLTLDNGIHTVVYTIGKNTCIIDGTATEMDYTLTSFDGLPLLKAEQFCQAFGYEFDVNSQGEVIIFTHQYEFYKNKQQKHPPQWNFDIVADNEGWTSDNMELFTINGYMIAESTSSNDPMMFLNPPPEFDADDYTKVTVRCRYKYKSNFNLDFRIYFVTEDAPFLDESKTIKLYYPSCDSKGDWVELTYDLTENPTWTGKIVNLRIDPFDAKGVVELDYIRFE